MAYGEIQVRGQEYGIYGGSTSMYARVWDTQSCHKYKHRITGHREGPRVRPEEYTTLKGFTSMTKR